MVLHITRSKLVLSSSVTETWLFERWKTQQSVLKSVILVALGISVHTKQRRRCCSLKYHTALPLPSTSLLAFAPPRTYLQKTQNKPLLGNIHQIMYIYGIVPEAKYSVEMKTFSLTSRRARCMNNNWEVGCFLLADKGRLKTHAVLICKKVRGRSRLTHFHFIFVSYGVLIFQLYKYDGYKMLHMLLTTCAAVYKFNVTNDV